LTVYAAHLDDDKVRAVIAIRSLKKLQLLGDADETLLRNLRELRSDLDVAFYDPRTWGSSFSYRYVPVPAR
jgi:hypothetical protein